MLDALTFAGVYEPNVAGGAAAGGMGSARRRARSARASAALITGMVLFLAGSVGTYFFYQHKRAQDHLQAEALLATVETQLHAGKPDALPDVRAGARAGACSSSRAARARRSTGRRIARWSVS